LTDLGHLRAAVPLKQLVSQSSSCLFRSISDVACICFQANASLRAVSGGCSLPAGCSDLIFHLPLRLNSLARSSSVRRLGPDEFVRVSGPGTALLGRRCLPEGGLGRCKIPLAGALRVV
jgi:hypothetical protein